jgi:hypothetical protein
MEQAGTPEHQAEREPQPHDIAIAAGEVLSQLAHEADPLDVSEGLELIDSAVDLEEAMGYAASLFAELVNDDEVAMQLLGEMLQLRAILPYGDAAREAETAQQQQE